MKNEEENEYFPKVYLEGCSFEESGFRRGGKYWKAQTLYKYVEDNNIKPFKFPLASLNLLYDNNVNVNTLDDLIYQSNRIYRSNIKYPIILDDYGQIADGYHRIMKAIILGKRYIMAYRLDCMPKPDLVDDGKQIKK